MKWLAILLLTGAALAQDCPVEVSKVSNGFDIAVKMKNVSAKEIKGQEYLFFVVTDVGDRRFTGGLSSNKKVKPSDEATFHAGRLPVGEDTFHKDYGVVLTKVLFADGSTWKDNTGLHCGYTTANYANKK